MTTEQASVTQNSVESIQTISGPSHAHYSPEVQQLVEGFNRNYQGAFFLSHINFKERVIFIESMQAAWNLLVKARRHETGYGTYLTPERYDVAVKTLKGSTAQQH